MDSLKSATLWGRVGGGAEPTDRGDSTSLAPPTRERLPHSLAGAIAIPALTRYLFEHITVVLLATVTAWPLAADETAAAGGQAPTAGQQSRAPRYTERTVHDPDGIGKFYLGREIARVMGFGPGGQGADWLERAAREREEQLSLLLKSLDLKPGMVVADVGAGSGVVSVRMAGYVGTAGRVLAVDLQQEMLDRLAGNLKAAKITNVVPVRGTQRSTGLPAGSVDLALLVDVYHELEYPWEMMRDISRIVKPGGRVVLVEYRQEDPAVPIKRLHKMTEAQVKREIGRPEFGLKWTDTIAVLPRQHIVVFARLPAPAPAAGR